MKRSLPLLGLCLFLAGCGGLIPPPQSDPTRYYVLTGPPPAEAMGGRLRIGLQRIELAAYLKSPDLIVRQGRNELRLQDYARWGEPLDAGISRLLRTAVENAPGVGQVYLQPFPLDVNPDYNVRVDVLRCEGGDGSAANRDARFVASFEITRVRDGRLVVRRTFVAPPAPWDGRNFDVLAGLLSADVAALGQEIVSALPPAPPAAP